MRKLPKYIKWIKEQPCIHCGCNGSEPHHVIGFGMGRMGGKAGDYFSVPLCRICHSQIHDCWDEGWIKPQLRWLHETLEKAFDEGVLDVR